MLGMGEVKSVITDSTQTDMSDLSKKLLGHLNLLSSVNSFLFLGFKISSSQFPLKLILIYVDEKVSKILGLWYFQTIQCISLKVTSNFWCTNILH